MAYIGLNIFHHLKNDANFPTSEAVSVAAILGGKKGYHNSFYSKAARDHFDACLSEIKTNGVYQQLVKQAGLGRY